MFHSVSATGAIKQSALGPNDDINLLIPAVVYGQIHRVIGDCRIKIRPRRRYRKVASTENRDIHKIPPLPKLKL